MLVYEIALTLIPEIGNVRGRRMLEVFGSAEAALKTDLADLAEATEIPIDALRPIELQAVFPAAEAELKYMEQNGIRAIPILSEEYPDRLRECPDAPLVLYVKGRADFNTERWISIVGTRKATAYGRKMTHRIVEGIADRFPDAVIVSGLAYGTDIQAHLSALECGLRTVAVLGNPLGYTYPRPHAGHALRIAESGGSVVSEFHSLFPLTGQNFLRRNRIIAGLSSGTIVIESARRGGSLSTATHAGGYYRDVMAVPGRTNDPLSEGCNRLIRDNKAALVTCADDVFHHLNWEIPAAPGKKDAEDQPLFPALSPEEKTVVKILREHQKVTVDELAVLTGWPVSRISSLSLSMEMKGILRKNPGNTLEIA